MRSTNSGRSMSIFCRMTLPMLKLNPTSGVDLDNAGEFLKNGANSVGLVAPLFPADAVAAGDWGAIQANAQKVIGNVKAALA